MARAVYTKLARQHLTQASTAGTSPINPFKATEAASGPEQDKICWSKGQEQCTSKVPARGLLLEGGGITQNGAVGTGLLEVRWLWVRTKLYQNLLGGGQNGARLVDCMRPLGCSSKDAGTEDPTVHKTRRNEIGGRLGSTKEAFCTGKLGSCSTDFFLTCFGNVV